MYGSTYTLECSGPREIGASVRMRSSRAGANWLRDTRKAVYTMHIAGYKIEREIGHGGMATVYLAVQESLGRPAALKVLSAALAADRTFSDRFIREARTIARLSHPNIVAIYDVGISNHDHYLALEYIGGGDLKSRVRQGALDPRAAVAIIREIAAALGYAHVKGFVHRDVKPENILFRENGMAVLTDFGIARSAGGGTRMTGMGMSIGTPHYMSPEQARGLTVDGRSDLYALGIVLYEMLTGVVPYDAEESLAIGIKHLTEPVPVLTRALRSYQWLIDRMLAKDPNARYRTAEELVLAIDDHDPAPKPRASRPAPTVVMPPARAEPHLGGDWRTVVMPAAAVGEAATAKKLLRSSNSATALKWALIGGLAAIGSFGAFWFVQNRATVGIPGGGGIPGTAPATQGSGVTDLEAALRKSTGAVSTAQSAPAKSAQATVPSVPAKTAPPTPPVASAKTAQPIPPVTPTKAPQPPTEKEDPVNSALTAWQTAQQAGTRDAYQAYLNDYPNSSLAVLARIRISNLSDTDRNEANAWRLAEQANSRGGYERFLKAHPNSTFAVLAKARLNNLK